MAGPECGLRVLQQWLHFASGCIEESEVGVWLNLAPMHTGLAFSGVCGVCCRYDLVWALLIGDILHAISPSEI